MKFIKNDKDKPRPTLLPAEVLLSVAKVMTYGANKYSADNWKKCNKEEWYRYLDAAYRHMLAHQSGELEDSETGELHLSHAICSLMFLVGLHLNEEKQLEGLKCLK